MFPRISRFERRIILAILLCALTPSLSSLLFIPMITETKLSLSINPRVNEHLENSALFYKEFFDAKKREYSARAETISKDPILIRAARWGDQDDVRERLQQVLDDNQELRSASIYTPANRLMLTLDGPTARQGEGFIPKTIALPLGVGEAPRIELTFVLPKRYMKERAQAEEIATVYATSLKMESERARGIFLGFATLTAFVVFLALAVGYVLARGVTKRIARLASATERVARGESGFTVPVGGNDEITELIGGFNKMIEEVAEARDRIVFLEKISGWQEFARRLAHEIKNPLTPIRLSIQELKRRVPETDPRFKKLVEDASDVVEEEIGALTRLVDEFSQFAKLPDVVPELVDVKEFLEEFLSAYGGFEPDAKVTLEISEGEILAAIDRVLMKRVLANLVMNAIQATGKGKAEITIRCYTIPATGAVELRVEDNGPGVSSEKAEKVFEPYYTTKSEGTGLGLAIVKRTVLQHQGSIALRRSPVGGAAFVIHLPPAEKEP